VKGVIIMEHRHHGKSSESFLDSDEILRELNFNGDETFMDAGCGDGHIAIRALNDYIPDGIAYAVDNYSPSIESLNAYKSENNLENLIPIEADIAKGVFDVDDGSIDVLLMLNVFHGFKASGGMDDVIEELKRLICDDGEIVIMDFKPIEMKYGPPVKIRSSPDELEELFAGHGLKKSYINDEIGQDISEGKSHYLIKFEKE
jgi:SAM-dependent methyltransferase